MTVIDFIIKIIRLLFSGVSFIFWAIVLIIYLFVTRDTFENKQGVEYKLSFKGPATLHGEYGIIGHPNKSHSFNKRIIQNVGAATILKRVEGKYTPVATLKPKKIREDEEFGFSVDIYGDYAIVGALAHGGNKGRVYIFQHQSDSVWNEILVVEATEKDFRGDAYRIGRHVSISGDYAVFWPYIYRRDGNKWIPNFDGNPYDKMPEIVKIDMNDDYIAIGTRNNGISLYKKNKEIIKRKIIHHSKEKYFFSNNEWNEPLLVQEVLFPEGRKRRYLESSEQMNLLTQAFKDSLNNIYPDQVIEEISVGFTQVYYNEINNINATAIALSEKGNIIVIGDMDKEIVKVVNLDDKQAKIFTLQASDALETDVFGYGYNVAISEKYILVAANKGIGGREVDQWGALYIYTFNPLLNEYEENGIFSSEEYSGDTFGHTLSISGDFVLLGLELGKYSIINLKKYLQE